MKMNYFRLVTPDWNKRNLNEILEIGNRELSIHVCLNYFINFN